MPKTDPKKPAYPSKTCPKCGKYIHARLRQHEACGWMQGAEKRTIKRRKPGRPKLIRAVANGGITLADIQAVKAVVDKLGAAKVRQLAEVLA
jgi:hypothetical protein